MFIVNFMLAEEIFFFNNNLSFIIKKAFAGHNHKRYFIRYHKQKYQE